MKKLFYSLLICSSVLPAIAMNSSDTKSVSQTCMQRSEEKMDKVVLRGHLIPKGTLRSGGDALNAILQESIILIDFYKDVGVVSITIENRTGQKVYSAVADSKAGQVFIPLTGLSSGSYTITFSNGISAMWGDFEL